MIARALAALLLIALSGAAAAAVPGGRHDTAETAVIEALAAIRAGHHARAGETLRGLIARRPDFRLARYLHAELLAARAGRPVAAEAGAGSRALLREARLRWRHHRHPPPVGAVPNALLRLAPEYRHAIVVDLRRHRLYLFRNDGGRARLVADYYASIGTGGYGKRSEGDLRTPVGIYHVDGYKPDRRLPELYGAGALTLDYPNAWDRLFGRTGYGIWVHGVPQDTYNRPPLASEGCVVVANEDLAALREHAAVGRTPVVFTDELAWLTPAEAMQRQQALLVALRDWRRRHLAGHGAGAAREVALSPLAGELRQVSVYAYPGEPGLRVTSFLQGRGAAERRMLYWRNVPDAGWQVVHQSGG